MKTFIDKYWWTPILIAVTFMFGVLFGMAKIDHFYDESILQTTNAMKETCAKATQDDIDTTKTCQMAANLCDRLLKTRILEK